MEGNADSADTQRMFFTVVGNAIAAHRLEIGKQRVEPGQCLWRAGLVSAADQCFNRGIGKLRQIGFAVGGEVEGKVIAARGYGTKTLRADDLVDEHKVIFLDRREVDGLVQLLRQLLQERPRQRYEIAA